MTWLLYIATIGPIIYGIFISYRYARTEIELAHYHAHLHELVLAVKWYDMGVLTYDQMTEDAAVHARWLQSRMTDEERRVIDEEESNITE